MYVDLDVSDAMRGHAVGLMDGTVGSEDPGLIPCSVVR